MRKMKKIGAAVLAVVLVCSAIVLPEVYAAGKVDTNAKCSVQINSSIQRDTSWNNLGEDKYLSELESNAVDVKLYKVAEITSVGNFEEAGDFAGLDLSRETLDESIRATGPAAAWQTIAQMAEKIVVDKKLKTSLVGSTGTDGTYTFKELDTGLYLIMASKESTNRYRYEFPPYLVSLPNNYYFDIVENAEESNPPAQIPANADEWVYDLTGTNAIGLKPARFNRYGYLKIEKDVPVMNIETPGEVFVYEVTATLDNGIVYNDVVAIDYHEQKYAFVGPILADADVVVKEVYQGSSYVQVSAGVPEISKIQAEELFDKCITFEDVKKATGLITEDNIKNELIFKFTNEHNNVPNGGTGVVNAISPSGMTQDYQGQGVPASGSQNQ